MNWPRRLREWWEIVRLERAQDRRIPWLKMLRAVCEGPVPRRVWFQRMLTCYHCPVHNIEHWTCRNGRKYWIGLHQCWNHKSKTGCGCHTPFLALSARPYEHGCWGYTLATNHPEVGPLGWPAYQWPSLWQQGKDLLGHFRNTKRRPTK